MTDAKEHERLLIKAQVWLEVIDEEVQRLQKKRARIITWLERRAETAPVPKGLPREKIALDKYPKEFELLWVMYPSRGGIKVEKRSAFTRFQNLRKSDWPGLEKAIRNYAKSQEAMRGFARDMKRFLKDDYWPLWINPTPAMLAQEKNGKKYLPATAQDTKLDAAVEAAIHGSK